MNNARVIIEEETKDNQVIALRQKAEQLAETLDALQNIASSNYWKVLKQNVFDVELGRSKSRLENSNDTTEMFRLQGEIRFARKFDLEKMITDMRNELKAIRNNINE